MVKYSVPPFRRAEHYEYKDNIFFGNRYICGKFHNTMTETEKMCNGEFYDFTDEAVAESQRECSMKLKRLNALTIYDDSYRKALRAIIPTADETATVMTPFLCDHGHRITLGKGVFINYRCTMLDSGGIKIGNRTKIGPDCRFYTPQHPIDYIERRKPIERGEGIEIGEDCWIGGGVTVCPGVKIGDRCIIGAGSVVVHDIPDDSLAAGNPATVKRKLR